MGRKRSTKNGWMPDYTKIENGYFVYYRQSTREYQRLTKADAQRWEMLKAYDQFMSDPGQLLKDCIYAYLDSPQFKFLAPGTQKKYRSAIATQANQELLYSFGDMEPEDIGSPDVRRFMDSWAHQPGKANSMHTALSAVFQWCIERGYIQGVNPCRNVKKFSERKGGRYVNDLDYKAFFNFLIDQGKVSHACAMAIAYLCGSRQQDVLRLLKRRPFSPKESDCYACDEGLMIYQQKTGKVQIKRWSEELRRVYDLASRQNSEYVICNLRGEQYTRGGFNSGWRKAQVEAAEKGTISARFRFHDMKIKASSDSKAEDRAVFLGATQSTAERYNRTPDAVDPVR